MKSWREIWKGCFTPEECQRIIDFGMSIPPVEGGIGHGGQFVVNKDMRSSTIRWLPRWHKDLLWMFDRISARAEWSNNKSFGLDIRDFTEVQFTEYDAQSAGHYSWHEDNTWVYDPFDKWWKDFGCLQVAHNASDGEKAFAKENARKCFNEKAQDYAPLERKMSMVIQLSDPTTYTGGKLELQGGPLAEGEFGGQGDMIFFPAFNRHQVTQVESGKRYSLVTWFKGPPFR